MSVFKKTLCFLFLTSSLLSPKVFSGEHYIEYSKHATVQEALEACSQLFYRIGADEFYPSSGCGVHYAKEGDSAIDLVAEGTPFYRITGGNWCTDVSGRYCLGDFYYFIGISPGYFLAPVSQPTCEREGNPCDPVSGRKMETEQDFRLPESYLRLTHYYASTPSTTGNSDMGTNWRHNYSAVMEHKVENNGDVLLPRFKWQVT